MRASRGPLSLAPLVLAGLAACTAPGASELDSAARPTSATHPAEPQPVHLPRGAWQPTAAVRPQAWREPASAPAPWTVLARAREIPEVQRAIEQLPLRKQVRDARLPGFVIDDEESLRAVVEVVRNVTGLPLVVSPSAESAVLFKRC